MALHLFKPRGTELFAAKHPSVILCHVLAGRTAVKLLSRPSIDISSERFCTPLAYRFCPLFKASGFMYYSLGRDTYHTERFRRAEIDSFDIVVRGYDNLLIEHFPDFYIYPNGFQLIPDCALVDSKPVSNMPGGKLFVSVEPFDFIQKLSGG
jgi:hypothetical protein